MRICIDPGHGGHDPGACSNGLREADINLAVAGLLLAQLHPPHDIMFTRSGDVSVQLYNRAVMSNSAKAHLFVSLHCNAATNVEANGVEVCYFPSKPSRDFANDILTSISPLFRVNRGLKERPELVVLKHTEAPAVLVEMGFVTNQSEATMLKSKEFQQSLALAIAKGIKSYAGRLHR